MAKPARTTRILLAAACAAALLAALAFTLRDNSASRAELPLAVALDAAPTPPPIKHVFIIVLENKLYETTFGPGTEAPYLADTMVKAGALLTQYYGIGHYSLDNYIAMISGQAPNPVTQADCGKFIDFVETGVAEYGQAIGKGCVYPAHVQTIANQLEARGLTWHGYMEDMGNDPTRESATCGHARIGEGDMTEGAQKASPGHPLDQYAAKHDPFVYFHSIIDSTTCDHNVVPLSRLEADLASADSTPNYIFISPNLCNDGHDSHCVSGEQGGLAAANGFLRKWVPLIRNSPAFRDGLLIVTFDEASSKDATACCDEQPGPNAKAPGIQGPGGGRIGAVLISPFIRPGTVSNTPYNHYSMLRSIEDVFGLDHLGYAGQDGLRPFGADVYTAATGSGL
ncbi:MAG TPA: alkaline phosphatase family protein [Gemmatimonadaceae bacterium]|nr:alkaline phosphatase family protein [Gemmatimonadaceae bacterium]